MVELKVVPGTRLVTGLCMLSGSLSAHQSGTANGFLSLVPSEGSCLGAEFPGPKGRSGGCANPPSR